MSGQINNSAETSKKAEKQSSTNKSINKKSESKRVPEADIPQISKCRPRELPYEVRHAKPELAIKEVKSKQSCKSGKEKAKNPKKENSTTKAEKEKVGKEKAEKEKVGKEKEERKEKSKASKEGKTKGDSQKKSPGKPSTSREATKVKDKAEEKDKIEESDKEKPKTEGADKKTTKEKTKPQKKSPSKEPVTKKPTTEESTTEKPLEDKKEGEDQKQKTKPDTLLFHDTYKPRDLLGFNPPEIYVNKPKLKEKKKGEVSDKGEPKEQKQSEESKKNEYKIDRAIRKRKRLEEKQKIKEPTALIQEVHKLGRKPTDTKINKKNISQIENHIKTEYEKLHIRTPESYIEKYHNRVLKDTVFHKMNLELNNSEPKAFKARETAIENKYGSYEELESRVHSHEKSFVELICQSLQLYKPEQILLSFNGGKDCTVVLHQLVKFFKKNSLLQQIQIPALYITDPLAFKEVDEFVDDCEKLYNIKLIRKEGPIKQALETVCKENPNIKAVFMGCRRSDPFCKDLNIMQQTDPGWPSLMRINPILDWKCRDVWEYLYVYDVPYCSLYNHGYTSIGNTKNTKPNPHLKILDLTSGEILGYMPGHELLDNDELERAGRL